MKKIKRIINNIKLCIKYPFLYPRNRFTNTHYVNWKFKEWYSKLRKESTHFDKETFKSTITNRPKYILYKICKWIHDYPMQLFHCIPTYTELDAMDKGWRKAFGVKMCEEIKQALLKSGGRKDLYKYRIMQIKEKWGGLRWYDAWSTHEIMKIISKYEGISYRTCIECGKPAKWVSKGWICPYCDDCKEKDREYDRI